MYTCAKKVLQIMRFAIIRMVHVGQYRKKIDKHLCICVCAVTISLMKSVLSIIGRVRLGKASAVKYKVLTGTLSAAPNP